MVATKKALKASAERGGGVQHTDSVTARTAGGVKAPPRNMEER